jgi:hypothetical protein
MELSAIREMVQKLPQWVSSMGRESWQKIGAVAMGVLAAAGAYVYLGKRFGATQEPPFKVGDEVRFVGWRSQYGHIESINMRAKPYPTCSIRTQNDTVEGIDLRKLELHSPLQIGDKVLYKGQSLTTKLGKEGQIIELKGLRRGGFAYTVRFEGDNATCDEIFAQDLEKLIKA